MQEGFPLHLQDTLSWIFAYIMHTERVFFFVLTISWRTYDVYEKSKLKILIVEIQRTKSVIS